MSLTLSLLGQILLECAHVCPLLGRSLVGAVAELGRGINPLEIDLLERLAADLRVHRLSESDEPLLDTGNGALDQEEVVLDLTVPDETAHAAKHQYSFRYLRASKLTV